MTTGSFLPPEPLRDPAPGRSAAGPGRLTVDADLDIEVDTAAGQRATGRLTSNARGLRLDLDHPEVLAGTADRSTLTEVAARLTQADLRAELHGPGGRIAVVDPARTSRVAAVLFGSPHITVDRTGWLLAARTASPAIVSAIAVGVAALLAGAVAVRRRRS